MKNYTRLIKLWATDRNLHTAGAMNQLSKLLEEVGELASAINKNNKDKIIDSIGDAYVVLTILAMQYNLNIEDCIEQAYNEIKDRKGKLINGIWVKEQDLKGE